MCSVQNTRGDDRREISLQRAEELKARISDFLTAKKEIPTGFKLKNKINSRRKRILEFFDGNEDDWNNYSWQLKNRITDADTLGNFLDLSEEDMLNIKEVEKKYRWAVSPYYLSLMDENDKSCPVRLQGIPSKYEIKISYGNQEKQNGDCDGR
ncbi:MAG: lysine 2,3-aminomutase, partial [Candidatus Moranbacteria bacterium]|nr:lysine 2,3-aminomutase [Candidatus Moranbacteria bacterium]